MKNSSQAFISLEELQRNFDEVKAGYTPARARDESNRCLYCYDAPCIQACPTGINVPSFIKSIATGNMKGAARTIMEANPVGATCSRVCPTEELCEGACVLKSSTQPIMIGDLQRYATDWAIQNEQALFQPGERNGLKAAIVGSGPAGLSAARELALLGYEVCVYEAKEKAGGLNTYGIVSFRLPQRISFWEVSQIEKLGVKIITNTTIGRDIQAEDLLSDYDAVVLAAGMSKVPRLGIEGEDLAEVHDAIEFVEKTKRNELSEAFIGKSIAVIGAGNTAIDAATCSGRLGAENVKILYRRTRKEMTAYDFEYEFAKQENVEFRWLTAPKRIIAGPDGSVKQLECVRMQLTEEEKGGRGRPVIVPGSEFLLEVDAVILAIGQTRHTSLIEAFGLEHVRGVVKVNLKTYQTSNPKVFAAGDVIFGDGQGEAMVVTAAQQGKKAAYAIHQTLKQSSIERV